MDIRAVATKLRLAPCNGRSISQDRSEGTITGLNFLNMPQLMLDVRALTTVCWVAPCQRWPIIQNRHKGTSPSLDLLHLPKLIFERGAVTTSRWITPCNHWSICQDGSECTIYVHHISIYALDLLHVPQSMLNSRAVTTQVWVAPGNHRSILSDWKVRGQDKPRGLNDPDVDELPFHCRAFATIIWIAPWHNGFVFQDSCECTIWSLIWSTSAKSARNPWISKLSPPALGWPHVTTDLSARMAANAPPFAGCICSTCLSSSLTAELSPPWSGEPHVTTDLSSRMAAKAPSVEWTFFTFSRNRRDVLSPPYCGLPHVTTDPSPRTAANAEAVAWTNSMPSEVWTWVSPPWRPEPHVTILSPPWHHNAKALCIAVSSGWQMIALRSSRSPIPTLCRDSCGFCRMRPCAVTSLSPLRDPSVKDLQAIFLECPTVEDSGTSRTSFLPLG